MAEPLGIAASIITVLELSGTVITYLSAVKGASEDRQRLLIEVSTIRGLLYSLKDVLEAPQVKDTFKAVTKMLVTPNGPLELSRAVLKRLEARLTVVTGAAKVWKALRWPFDKAEVSDLLTTLERQKTLFSLALGNDHSRLSLAIKEDVKRLHDRLLQVSNGVTQLQIGQKSQQQHQEHQAIIDWLSPLRFGAKQKDYYSRAQQGTGKWLLEADAFNQWLNSTTGVLWCPGNPGAGKTILASIIIDHIQQNIVQDDVGLVYVYCGYKEPNQSALNLIGSLLQQLVRCHDDLSDDIIDLYTQHKSSQSHLSMDQSMRLLRTQMGLYSKVFVVVDALDELSEENRERYQFITEILRLPSSAKILATSRHIATIKDAFKGIASLEISANSDDIKRYIEKRIDETPQLASLLNDRRALRDAISDAIVDKAKGMFLVAELHMNSLEMQDNLRAVHKAIQNLPRELDAIYEDALERIRNQKVKRGLQVLSWICYAVRPLTVPELLHALAVDPGDEELIRDALPSNVSSLVSACAGLVTVDQESNIIRLVHYTTQHFFERTRADCFPSAATDITRTCLTYLSFNNFQGGACLNNQLSQRIIEYPFLLYAANYWAEHFRDTDDETLKQLLCTFLEHNAQLSCAVQAASIPEHPFFGLGEHLPRILPLLWVAAHYNLKDVLLHLLRKGKDIEARNPLGETALYRASLDGHEGIVLLLLEHGAEVNARGGHHGTALHAAIDTGNKSVIVMLLNHGADLESQGSEITGTALQGALGRGDQAMATFLLERGADPNAGLGRYGNALCIAIHTSQTEMVTLLLDRGADINGAGLCYAKPLTVAVSGGFHSIACLLLDRGADTKDMIQFAVSRGDHDLVRSLIERTVRSGNRDNILDPALMTAALKRSYETFLMLLDHGADIHARGGRYYTMLQTAAASCRQQYSRQPLINVRKIVALLLEKGVSIEIQGGYYGNALQAAAAQGHDDVVTLLLQWGADVNTRGGHFGTALQAAASGSGHFGIEGESVQYEHEIQMQLDQGVEVEEVVKSLLSQLARRNWEESHHTSPVKTTMLVNSVDGMDAKSTNYKKVISLLNDRGVDVNAHNGYLYFDDRPSKYEKIIYMLLEKGADINVLGGHFGSALQAAVCESHGTGRGMPAGGNLKIARLFLDRGADVNAQGGHYGTALQAAAAEGNLEMVKMLLRAGAEVNYKGGCYNNALLAATGRAHCGMGSGEEIVAYLLDNGAEIKRSDWSRGAVSTVVESGSEKLVIMLLDSCSKNDQELFVKALTLAAENGQDVLVQRLLKRRAGIALQDGYLEIALQAASGHGCYAYRAAESSYINILNMLMTEGARVNQPGGRYGNALQAAIANCNYELVDVLLQNNADVNAKGGIFGDALQALASSTATGSRRFADQKNSSRGQRLMMTLLDRGVDINAEGGEYGTPLQAAVVGGLEETVVTLLKSGANINHQGGKFGTALHAAVFENYLHMMQILLRYGVKAETPDQYGFTVLYWVRNDTILTSTRHREVRTLVETALKGQDISSVDTVIRRKTIFSILGQLKQMRNSEDSRYYDLGKAFLYDGRCEAATYCFQKQYLIQIRDQDVDNTTRYQKFPRYCFNCYKDYENNEFYICKVCKDFVVCLKCIEGTNSREVCQSHDFLRFKPDMSEETKTVLEEDRLLGEWIDQTLAEYRI